MRTFLTLLFLAAALDARTAERWPSTITSTGGAVIAIITPNALASLGDSESLVVIDLATDPLAVATPLPADRDTVVVLDDNGFGTPAVWVRARQIAALGYRRVYILWSLGC